MPQSQKPINISIVIVSWNAKGYLLDCLESLTQTTKGLSTEVIVVDNASSDGSPDAVESRFPNVKLIRNGQNLGFAKGNNIGISQSKGRYVCLINSDVILLGDCLKRLVAFMDSNPSVGMSGPRILNGDRTVQLVAGVLPNPLSELGQALFLHTIKPLRRIFPRPEFSAPDLAGVRSVPFLYGCFWMVSRTALDTVGLLDERFFMYGEDVDWCKRFNDAGFKVVYFPEVEAVHFGCASSMNARNRYYVQMKKSRLLYFQKHYGRAGRFVCYLSIFLGSIARLTGWIGLSIIMPGSRKEAFLMRQQYIACLRWLVLRQESPV